MDTGTGEEISLGAKIIAATAALMSGMVGAVKLWRNAMDKKADRAELEAINDRLTRHRESNEEQSRKYHAAILDLYAKNEKMLDLYREKEQRDVERHITILDAINDLKRST